MSNTSRTAARLLAVVAGTLFAAYALYSLSGLLAAPQGWAWLYWMRILASATAAVMSWWFALRGHIAESRAVMQAGCLSGLVVGGVSFLAGFLGPILLEPDANQGPLLGIFVTGPLGFIAGTVGGVIFAKLRRRKALLDKYE